MNLESKDIGYIISNNTNGLLSYLYSRGYRILEIKEYYKNNFKDSVMAWSIDPNQSIEKECFDIMNHFNGSDVIMKKIGSSTPKKLNINGSERHLNVIMYNTDQENKSYIYEGISFSFVEEKMYKFPKTKDDFKNGMIIECYSTNRWNKKIVNNIDHEFNDIYKTLSKYDKVRIVI